MGSDKGFFLGRIYDLKKSKITTEDLYYDPADLVTHALVTGMTGSGKTGLCIGLIEEAALQGIPAILIDPKGDLTNLMLTFPDLLPADFEPWIDANNARRENKTTAEVAEGTASSWKKGLADWGLGEKNLSQLKDAVERVVYTPGSSTGQPVSIMASFDAPDMSWDENEEVLREKISATVTALLTLVGLKDIDPLRSREHILLSNIIENNWRKGMHLDLTTLILQTQDPPFETLGAFSLNNFFPRKDRGALAMLLNNFLASPTFQSWIDGVPLDIQTMLYTPEGKPRHSIFYLAHLGDAERMFFITLIYSAVESWMRKQRGTGNLRALVYFDEIHGYLPPVANPPSKPLIIRLLKTARAFGVGLVLTTQNPVDVDYKALSNAGTWMVGRLQTDQDKQRLLDGLESAAGGVPRGEYDRLISTLGKRVFLYHNVHEKKPNIFHTRWAMSYLAGPLTITQIPLLNETFGVKAGLGKPSRRASTPTAIAREKGVPSDMKPQISGVNEYFESVPKDSRSDTYTPALLASAEIRYLKSKPSVDFMRSITAIVEDPRENGQVWEDFVHEDFDPGGLLKRPQSGMKFESLPEFMNKPAWMSSQVREFEHWIYETDMVSLRSSPSLGVTVGPEASEEEFLDLCREAAEKKADLESAKLSSKYATKKTSLEKKISSQELKVDKYRKEMTSRGFDTALNVGGKVLDALSGRKVRLSTSVTKGRMTADARGRLKEAEEILKNYQDELANLDIAMEDERQALVDRWMAESENVSEVKMTPTKQNIRITHYGILWKT
jgi:tetrahydromethanopterin S-methyltransferase subunit F